QGREAPRAERAAELFLGFFGGGDQRVDALRAEDAHVCAASQITVCAGLGPGGGSSSSSSRGPLRRRASLWVRPSCAPFALASYVPVCRRQSLYSSVSFQSCVLLDKFLQPETGEVYSDLSIVSIAF